MLISFLFSAFLISNCNAKNIDGYIITNDLTIVHGKIKTNNYNLYSGGYIINGIPLETFHSKVAFKGENDKHFHFYEPIDIQGFGFIYKTVEYRFRSFKLQAKSLVKKDRSQHRFLVLIYEGELNLYRDISRIITPEYSTWSYTNVFYINNTTIGLSRVVSTKRNDDLKDLLTKYSVDIDFLNTIPEQIEFQEIQNILRKYDIWLKNKKIENEIY